MTLSFVSICLILALFSLVVVAIYVAAKPGPNGPSGWFLSAFLFAMAAGLANFLFMGTGVVHDAPEFAYLGNTVGVAAAPILYLYTRALTDPAFRLSPRLLFNAVPVVAFLLAIVMGYTLQPGQTQRAILSGGAGHGPVDFGVLAALIFAYVLAYLLLTLRRLWRHRRQLRERYSDTSPNDLDWLRVSVIGAIAAWLGSLLHELAVAIWPLVWLDELFRVALAGLALLLGLFFLTQALRQSGRQPREKEPPPENGEKYGMHRIDDKELERFANLLDEHLETTKLHLQGALTLDELAAGLPMTPREVSQTINRRHGRSYFDFINSRRIDHAKALLLSDPGLSVIEAMTASGFDSKSSFYAAFRKETGTTPSQFRRVRAKAD